MDFSTVDFSKVTDFSTMDYSKVNENVKKIDKDIPLVFVTCWERIFANKSTLEKSGCPYCVFNRIVSRYSEMFL